MSGILKQGSKIIGIYSKKFTDTEKRYTIVEKEMLSILRTLENFRYIILGCKITIFTDNKNNVYTKNMNLPRIPR